MALATGPAEPRDADAIARREAVAALDDLTDDLMAEDERELRAREVAVDDVEIRPADTARADAKQQLTGLRDGFGQLRRAERRTRCIEHQRAHG